MTKTDRAIETYRINDTHVGSGKPTLLSVKRCKDNIIIRIVVQILHHLSVPKRREWNLMTLPSIMTEHTCLALNVSPCLPSCFEYGTERDRMACVEREVPERNIFQHSRDSFKGKFKREFRESQHREHVRKRVLSEIGRGEREKRETLEREKECVKT